MSVFATGVGSQFLRRPLVGNVGNEPMSLSCWVKGTPGNSYVFAFVSPNTTVCFDWYAGTMYAEYYDGTGARTTALTGNLGNSLTNWTHFGLTLNGPTSITAYLNGSASGFSSFSANATNISNNMVEIAVGGATNPYSSSALCQIAECALWRGALSAAQWSAIAQGENPGRIMPGKLQDYFPLRGDGRNLGLARIGLAAVGGYTPQWGDHPNVVQMPRRRFYVVRPAGNTLSGDYSYGGESVVSALTQADPLSGAVSFGAEVASGALTQADPLSGIVGFGPESASGALTQANSFIGSLTFNPSVIGSLLEVDTFSGVLDLGGWSASGVIALDVHGRVDYGPLAVSGVVGLDLHGRLDYSSPVDAGVLTSANPLTGTLSFSAPLVLGQFSAAIAFSAVLDYSPMSLSGNLLEQDMLSGVLTFGFQMKATVVGAAFISMNFDYQVEGRFAQVNPGSGRITHEVTSSGVLTEADQVIGIVTFSAPGVSGEFTHQANPLSGRATFNFGVLGNLLESDDLLGLISYSGWALKGELSEHNLMHGSLSYNFGLSGELSSEIKQAPDPALLPSFRVARVRQDSRTSSPVKLDSRTAR